MQALNDMFKKDTNEHTEMTVAGKNVRSKNVRVKNVRLLFKNVRRSSERLAGRFCYLSFTPVLVIRRGGSARRGGLKEDGARRLKKQAC